MKLSQLAQEERDTLTVRIRRSVYTDLTRYKELVSGEQGGKIPTHQVVEAMLEQFMASDRDFQQRKKQAVKPPPYNPV